MPKFQIHHITEYTYSSAVRDSANQIMLFPIKDEYQEVLKHELFITGEPVLDVYKDYYGNEVGSFMHAAPHNVMCIKTIITAITKPRELPEDTISKEDQWEHLEQIKFKVPFIDFLTVQRFDCKEEVWQVLQTFDTLSLTPMRAALAMNAYVFKNFKYIPGITSVETTLEEIWMLKAGVCQDFAHILSAMLRMAKIPSRYVSGYICPNKNGMRGEGATHAWVEAYIPFYGWLGLDPTNNCIVDNLHVRLAVGRGFNDCSPVKGTYKGNANHKLRVGVSVSYENGQSSAEQPASIVMQNQPKAADEQKSNSWRKHMEMMQQQQQQ